MRKVTYIILIVLLFSCTNNQKKMSEALKASDYKTIEKLLEEEFIFDSNNYLEDAIETFDLKTIEYVTSNTDKYYISDKSIKLLTDGNKVDIIELLIDSGLDINNENSNHIEILKWAIDNNLTSIIILFFENGISSKKLINNLHITDYIYTTLNPSEIINLLKNENIRNRRGNNGSNIITRSVIDNNQIIIKDYFNNKYPTNNLNNNEFNKLEIIVKYWENLSSIFTFDQLLENLKLSEIKNTNALNLALEAENNEIIQLLLLNGLNINVKDDNNLSIFEHVNNLSLTSEQDAILSYMKKFSSLDISNENNYVVKYDNFNIFIKWFPDESSILLEFSSNNYFKTYVHSYKQNGNKFLIFDKYINNPNFTIEFKDNWTLYGSNYNELGQINIISDEDKNELIDYSKNIKSLVNNKWVIEEFGLAGETHRLYYFQFNNDRTVNITYYDPKTKVYEMYKCIYFIIYSDNSIAVAWKNIRQPGFIFEYKDNKWEMYTITSFSYGELNMIDIIPTSE